MAQKQIELEKMNNEQNTQGGAIRAQNFDENDQVVPEEGDNEQVSNGDEVSGSHEELSSGDNEQINGERLTC
ncbi:MAG: hypothetical protein EZS28_044668 [Streblomastix strix]|uniref:Uncharacterized protein n=1 Tax=Streblomastix strix TaxID=222440 RepID=A0A5J4TR26_9EUKA|nr:MAG: hypothetical protein EZS28_044668 [Streblomastix strix]